MSVFLTPTRVLVIFAALLSAAEAAEPIERFAPSETLRKFNFDLVLTKGVELVIEDKFGTPDSIKVWSGLPVDFGKPDDSQGLTDGWKLRAGHDLYIRKCVACHDPSGAGKGDKAAGLVPLPRDFRRGIFKWQSTRRSAEAGWSLPKPLRHDLSETIRLGIPGTAMPSFPDLEQAERAALVEYVRWLAIRGEFESALVHRFDDTVLEEIDLKPEIARGFHNELDQVSTPWTMAELESSIIRPTKRPESNAESIAQGKTLFSDRTTSCYQCHGNDTKGTNLPFPFRDTWGNETKAWDLTAEPFRGGIVPEDLFRRLRGGIHGSGMPTYPERFQSDEDIWHLVNYCLSITPENLRDRQVERRPPPKGYNNVEESIDYRDPRQMAHATGEEPLAAPIDWKGWGTLRGRFVFRGRAPATQPAAITRSQKFCGTRSVNESFLTGANGGLANVVVFLTNPNVPVKGNDDRSNKPATLEIKACRFHPHVLATTTGSDLVIKNSDPIGHNVTFRAERTLAFNRVLRPNEEVQRAFNKQELMPIKITNSVRPHMLAYVLPRENPYFVVTNDTGSFEISDLPAGGKLELQVWHERARRGLRTKDLTRGRLVVELKAGEVTDVGDIVVTIDAFD